MSPAQLSRALIGNPFQGARFTNYVTIDVQGLLLVQGRPNIIREARLALGGVAHKPCRDREAEAELAGALDSGSATITKTGYRVIGIGLARHPARGCRSCWS
jgi:hypothetical protein